MVKNINSAYRIKDILETARRKDKNLPADDIWADIFNINEDNQHKKYFIISGCLSDLHDEVELVRSKMSQLGYTSNLYEPSLNKCNSIFAVQSISATWSGLLQQITPETYIALGFCSEILPNEEDLIDQENLDELNVLVHDLNEILKESSLPQHTINIIKKHLSKIEVAISSYKAVGVKSLEEVMQSAYGEVIANETVFHEAKGTEELGKLSFLWQKTKTVLDGVVSANRRIGGVEGMAEKGQNLIEFLQGLNV